jgi:hypothetical protein
MFVQPVVDLASVLERKLNEEPVLRRRTRLPELFSTMQPCLANEHCSVC